MDRGRSQRRTAGQSIRFLTIVALAAATAVLPAGGASALMTYKVLHAFNGSDGSNPQATLTRDSKGNLYGVTTQGGLNQGGTIFELLRRYQGAVYEYKTIYNFCAKYDCVDGDYPTGQLIVDLQGNLYGTAEHGGVNGHGVAFELKPNARRTRWALQVLFNFCSKDSNCPDGSDPVAGLTYQGAQDGAAYDGVSPLYGTTGGGGKHTRGIAYELLLENGTWLQRIIYPFCQQPNCADGLVPISTMLMDASGNLYGTASGGAHGGGVIFELSPPVSGHIWSEVNLYDFCSLSNCADGADPGPLIFDGSGGLIGTTNQGGTQSRGTVFKLASGAETVLYSFCSKVNCEDGALPTGGVVMGKFGVLYGTTTIGGESGQNAGTVFQIDGSTFKTRYSFCAQPSCSDGEFPYGGLAIDKQGDLFGTTVSGGFGIGTVFELSRQ
jgi:uncharacterized repeat protein (TIGR03803 family)